MDLNQPISSLALIGPNYTQRLEKLDIKTIMDLLLHIPHRYQDLSLISKISKLQPGETATLKVRVISFQNVYTKTGKKIQKALFADNTGQIEATWFNQPFLANVFKTGSQFALAGKVKTFGAKLTLQSPEYEILDTKSKSPNTIHTGRLVPIYPETKGVSSKWLRSRIAPLLKNLPSQDHLPASIKKTYQLMDWPQAIKSIHFPNSLSDSLKAKKRLAFDEVFFLHLATLIRKQLWQQKQVSHSFQVNQAKVQALINSLPFQLTPAQNQAIKDILKDLKQNRPMNRLLEGDVGSGKTVVAAIAIYVCILNGRQAALMAPTQILAHQHEQTIRSLLKPLGIKISLITSSHKSKVTNHKSNLLVGTHALLHQTKLLSNLGLVVIDEQHRFGVEQRAQLLQKSTQKHTPHLLTMTATPIPRTIALTLYGNLDLSLIDQLPQGRKPVKTWVVPPEKRQSAYSWIRQQIKTNSAQAFIICPLIDQSDKESMSQVKAATAEYQKLKNNIFPDLKLDLLHGKLKAKDKQAVITRFALGKSQILVSTPVVEVGIDIPSASIILIEAAERFGLSTLHQLRGRVGRRGQQAYCLLFSQSKSPAVIKRLKALEKETSGLKLAEIDLKLRGPGQLTGTRQHGFVDLKIASFSNSQLISETRKAAEKILSHNPNLNKYPKLKQKVNQLVSQAIQPN